MVSMSSSGSVRWIRSEQRRDTFGPKRRSRLDDLIGRILGQACISAAIWAVHDGRQWV